MEKTQPLVSIVTPSYNQGRFIRETIESVLSQDYSPIEYWVMDGASTDDTVEILKTYGKRILWVSEKDHGQSHAVNKGWRRSKGEILGWLNSDDIYLPGAVRKAVEFLEGNPSVAAVYGEGYHIREDGSIIERYPTEPFSDQRLKETCFICQPTVFIRRNVLENVGFLDEGLNFCMDYDLWFRIAKEYRWGYLPEYLACTRFYPDAKTLARRAEAHREILKVVYRHQGSVPPSWIYGYGHAILEQYLDRSKPWVNPFFVLALICLSLLKFLRYNRKVPISEYGRWWYWLKNYFHWKWLRSGSVAGKK
jgi:glycosyltransferase involved in cell wall biosynthesis